VEVRTIFSSMRQRRAVPTAAEYGQLLRFVRRRLGRQDAEDVAQEMFLDMAASLAGSADAAPPTLGWLYTVARRRLVDEARRRARSRTVSLEVVPPPEARAPYGVGVARALDEALAALPEGQRRVVVERLLRGRSFADIGRSLGVTEEACRMRFMRGLQQLRRELERRGVEP
jgi:RNA polymerase sigma factor (sigma-70 family)